MLNGGRGQQSIDHRQIGPFEAHKASKMPPAIDSFPVDAQYPVGKTQRQIATEPSFQGGTARTPGKLDDAFTDLSESEDAQEQEIFLGCIDPRRHFSLWPRPYELGDNVRI